MKVKKSTLLLIASVVWLIAGFNVLRIGVQTYSEYVTVWNGLLSVLIFAIFHQFVFGKLVKKHTTRILGYVEEKQLFFKFFDIKSFIIMAVMMGGGIAVRNLHLASNHFIAVFYTGLGAALFLAGILFGVNYYKEVAAKQVKKKMSDAVHGSQKTTMTGEWIMKRYANISIVYAIVAMIFGVFYREFTKFNAFTGDTTLSVMHTHYFMLGMVFFLLMLLLEKSFSFSNTKTSQVLLIYHIGLNITGAAFLVRGILQVQSAEVSSALNASISGIAGIGHMLLGISIVVILLQVKKSIAK